MRRAAASLVEVLAVLGIIGLLIGMLLPAVQQVRATATKNASRNNLKQILLAVHSLSAAHAGRLPTVASDPGGINSPDGMFVAILPFLDQSKIVPVSADPDIAPVCRIYRSPADPSYKPEREWYGPCSYGANAFVFAGNPSLTHTFPDGTANTVAFAERYTECGNARTNYVLGEMLLYGKVRPTFADGGPAFGGVNHGDVHPVPSTAPGASTASEPFPGQTFQVRPTPWDSACTPELPQTPHPDGMLTAFADGSVRVVGPGVSCEVFWSAVTPAGGETLGVW